MVEELAPGLPANWLNGWLAAVGITVVARGTRLRWSREPSPLAILESPSQTPLAEQIAAGLPDEKTLKSLVLADKGLPRKPTLADFHRAANEARLKGDDSLAMSLTDLVTERKTDGSGLQHVQHGPFDPPVPRGVTLVERVIACRQFLEPDPVQRIRETLAGAGERVRTNGLGFDIRRLPSGVQADAPVMVDPVVECLCFVALRLFPVRGDGRQQLQRGWASGASQPGAFCWPVWSDPSDVWGIDALLDRLYSSHTRGERTDLQLYGVFGVFESVPYKPTGQSDVTRGYGARTRRVI